MSPRHAEALGNYDNFSNHSPILSPTVAVMAQLPTWLVELVPPAYAGASSASRNVPQTNPYSMIMGASSAPTMIGGGYPRQRLEAYLEWLQQATPEERQDAPGFAPYPSRAPDPARP